jgi:hypothetical protein
MTAVVPKDDGPTWVGTVGTLAVYSHNPTDPTVDPLRGGMFTAADGRTLEFHIGGIVECG